MHNICRAICSPGWALLLLTGCFAPPIRYASQDLLVRHDGRADALDVLILYDGIQTAPQQRAQQVATKFVERVVGGGREFMLVDWPLHVDLDSIAADASDDSDDKSTRVAWDGLRRDGLSCVGEISVTSSGFYVGEHERLALHQSFHIENATRLVEFFNRSLQLWIEDCVRDGSLAKETPLLDDETRAAWARLGKEQIKWLGLKDGGLELDLPMTPACVARIVAWAARASLNDPESARWYACIAASLTEMHSSDGRLRLRLGPTQGAIRLRIDGLHDYDATLSDHLRSSTDLTEQLPARAEVLRAFGDS